MRETWGLAVVVVLAYFLALFVAAYVGTGLLGLGEPEYRISYLLVPLIFFLTLLPFFQRGQLPTVSISLKETHRLHWAILMGVGLWVGSWVLTNWITAFRAAASGGAIDYGTATVAWDCRLPLTTIPRRLQESVLIPVMEEICFRGLVLAIFVQRGRPFLGLAVSALTFASYHPNFFEAVVAGVFLGTLYWKTQQLGLAIVAHITHNFLVALDAQCFHIDWVPEPIWWLAAIPPAILGYGVAIWAIRKMLNEKERWSRATRPAPPSKR